MEQQYKSIIETYEARSLLIKALIILKQNNFKKEDLLIDIKLIYNDIENNNKLKWDEEDKDPIIDLDKKYSVKPEFLKEHIEDYNNFYKRAKESNSWDLLDIIWNRKCTKFTEAFELLVYNFNFIF